MPATPGADHLTWTEGEAHAIARFAAGHLRADGKHRPGSAVAGAERELPVGQVGVLQPLMRAGVDRQLGPRTDGADLGFHQNLIGRRLRQFDLANFDLERLHNNGLAYFHFSSVHRSKMLLNRKRHGDNR